MGIFSDKIIQRGRGGIAAEEPALTLAEADFTVDAEALAFELSDGDPVTVADIFTNTAADAPTLALDGDWRVRFDGTQWLDGPTNLLDGLDGFMVAVAYEVPRLITDADTSDNEFSLFVSQAGSISDKPVRWALFQADTFGPRLDMPLFAVRREQEEADEGNNPKSQLFAGNSFASFTHVLVANVNLVTGVATLRKDGELIHSRRMESTGLWANDGWANIIGRYVNSTGGDSRYLHGDIKLMAGFYGAKSEAEAEAISDEMMGEFHTPLVIKIETEDQYDNLLNGTNPTDFVQFKYARYAGQPVLFRDAAARIPVTDPGRHLVRAIRHPITGVITVLHSSRDMAVWLGPELGTLFKNSRYHGEPGVFGGADYHGPRSIFTTATPYDEGPSAQSLTHCRSLSTGWIDEIASRTGGKATYSVLHAGVGLVADGEIDLNVRQNIGHTWSAAAGGEILVDGASKGTGTESNIVTSTTTGGIGHGGNDDRYLTGLIEASAWYDRVVSAAEIAIIAENL